MSDGSSAAAEAAYLARLQRRRDEMTSLVRGRKRAPMSAHIPPPPVLALPKRELEELSFAPSERSRAPAGAQLFAAFESQSQLDEQLQREVVAARDTPLAANLRHGGQRRSAPAEPPEFADIFNTARTVEDGFGRLSHSGVASGPGIRLRPDPHAHRVRKGAGKRAGLALSCDGWGTPSRTLR